jgi:hypothetical protein
MQFTIGLLINFLIREKPLTKSLPEFGMHRRMRLLEDLEGR